MSLQVVISIILAALTFLARHWVIRVFTQQQEVIAMAAGAMPVLVTCFFGEWVVSRKDGSGSVCH